MGDALDAVADDLADDILIVSNRQPYSHGYDDDGNVTVDQPAGGLTAGLDPVMQRLDGTWIAWGDGEADPDVSDENDSVRVPPADPSYTLKRVWLDEADVDDYYYGYSNRVLWPLCHDLTGRMEPDPGYVEAYERVNRRFADAVADAAGDGSLIWFQDYHFALAPRQVRGELPDATLFQFWHIPWPSWETFRAAPDADGLLDGLLANDLLGFHVGRYCENFLDCVEGALEDATVDRERNSVEYDGRTTHVRAFPLGIDAQRVADVASASDGAFAREFREEHGIDGETTLAIGVDRLDYTKGIPERLDALERFFEEHPERRGELTYVQKGSESRLGIPNYRALRNEVEDGVDRLNRRFGTDDWSPVVYTTAMYERDNLYELYHDADLALVSPLRDGMNLVAKEFVAAQTEDRGTLLLSELTGAHDEFGEFALSINPYDTAGFAEDIERALTMSEQERTERMRRMRQRITNYDLGAWMDDVFRTVAAVERGAEPGAIPDAVVR